MYNAFLKSPLTIHLIFPPSASFSSRSCIQCDILRKPTPSEHRTKRSNQVWSRRDKHCSWIRAAKRHLRCPLRWSLCLLSKCSIRQWPRLALCGNRLRQQCAGHGDCWWGWWLLGQGFCACYHPSQQGTASVCQTHSGRYLSRKWGHDHFLRHPRVLRLTDWCCHVRRLTDRCRHVCRLTDQCPCVCRLTD